MDMNAIIENLKTRRSVRAYKAEMPDQTLIDQVLEAGIYAPTGKNMQTPIIVEVTNKEVRDKLSRLNAAVLGVNADPFYGAPVVLVVLASRDFPTYVYDGSLVMGNLMNAAHSLGLATCWVHRAREVFDSEEGKALLREWGIEGDYEGIGHCILGYAKSDTLLAAKPRKEKYVYKVE